MEGSGREPSSIEAASVLWNISRAFLARLLFVVHSVATVWQTALLTGAEWVWGFALLILLVVFEGSHTIIMRAGDERKWFCSSVLLYVMATAPPIWMLEQHLCEVRASEGVTVKDGGVPMEQLRVQLVEQLMLVVLIVGRWLLPKGDISREQLSQILLAYLAISSDIVEFFDVFKEQIVYRNVYLQHLVLFAWTLSLLQFPFVLTVSRARKMRVAITNPVEGEVRTKGRGGLIFRFTRDVDLWAIVLANSLQDIPFLFVRIYLMAFHHLANYTMIFFTCKNALIIVLQTYRAFIIINDRYTVNGRAHKAISQPQRSKRRRRAYTKTEEEKRRLCKDDRKEERKEEKKRQHRDHNRNVRAAPLQASHE